MKKSARSKKNCPFSRTGSHEEKNLFTLCFLVIHADEHALIVELQVEVVRQADVVAVALLIDFRNNAAREVGLHILHNRSGNDARVP